MKKLDLRPTHPKRKLVIASFLVIAILIVSTVVTITINDWFLRHYIHFQSPILLQSPAEVKNRPFTLISPLATRSAGLAQKAYAEEPVYSPRTEIIAAVNAEWGITQVEYAENIISHESGFDPHSLNEQSGACGLAQSLPCSKMHCSLDDAKCQAKWFVSYIKQHGYGTPEKAWKHWLARVKIDGKDVGNWY